MYAILAFIPIIVTVVLMVAFNWPARERCRSVGFSRHHRCCRMEDEHWCCRITDSHRFP